MQEADKQIKLDIIKQLEWDSRVSAHNVDVAVKEGAVTLSGTVDNYNARLAAYDDAWGVPGVLAVDNRLDVAYAGITEQPQDAEIADHITSMLSWSPDIDENSVDVGVEGGRVTFDGSVDAYWKKFRVEELAANVNGVRDIVNRLAVVPTENRADEETAQDIVEALDRNAEIDVERIDVKVNNGVVTLSGMVDNRSAHQAAHDTALYTFGVIEVKDYLSISE